MASISSSLLGTQIFVSPPRPKTLPKKLLVRQAFVNRKRSEYSRNVQNHAASDANDLSITESNTQVPLRSTSSRPLANFQPSVWGDLFLHFHESNHNNHAREEDKMVEQLKEEVKGMLKKATSIDYVEQLEIIDAIQRLGIAYHFREEIDQALQDVFEKFENYCKNNLNLHIVALSFRLLRQHGYKVSSEIFEKFKGAKGDWIVPEIEPAKGILELFEATHLRVHNEDVLDDGFVFSRDYLDLVLPSLDSPYDELVHYALEQNSYRRGFPRVEARHYISIYDKFASRNLTLLRFAKLDFNGVQSVHKKELSKISRWWKDLDVKTNFPYARDRLVESYLWAMVIYFEPEYAFGRMILCKMVALITIVDDTFDAYGTFEELKLFNEATERWDISCLDQLPDYMKLLYDAVLRMFAEIEEEMTKLGALYRYTYAKEGVRIYMDFFLRTDIAQEILRKNSTRIVGPACLTLMGGWD